MRGNCFKVSHRTHGAPLTARQAFCSFIATAWCTETCRSRTCCSMQTERSRFAILVRRGQRGEGSADAARAQALP